MLVVDPLVVVTLSVGFEIDFWRWRRRRDEVFGAVVARRGGGSNVGIGIDGGVVEVGLLVGLMVLLVPSGRLCERGGKGGALACVEGPVVVALELMMGPEEGPPCWIRA